MTSVPSSPTSGEPFDSLIAAMLRGEWVNPETGRRAAAIPFLDIRLMDTTEGAEADLVAPLGLGRRLAVICDPRTHEALGARVARGLRAIAAIDETVVDFDEADAFAVAQIRERTRHADALIAVGSGTLQDLVKYATFLDRRPFATFATAASMNGYTSITASISNEKGFKQSLKAHTPRGLFMDVAVAAKAPPYLARSGLGDCLCRSSAQVDWRLSSRLLGTPYFELPFMLQAHDEAELFKSAAGLATGNREAIRTLYRLLTWTGLGTCFTGTSHHGSMSEHLVSHWIDMFAGKDHPGTLHGHQVGYAAVSMSRLQHLVLDSGEPPVLSASSVDRAAIMARYGEEMGKHCLSALSAKALDEATARRLSAEMARDWDAFRKPLREVMLPSAVLENALQAAGGYVTAAQSGLPAGIYCQALVHAREIRDRFSILDIAAEAGLLEEFAARHSAVECKTSAKGDAA